MQQYIGDTDLTSSVIPPRFEQIRGGLQVPINLCTLKGIDRAGNRDASSRINEVLDQFADLNVTEAHLEVSGGSLRIAQNLSFPATVHVHVRRGGKFLTDSGRTTTFNGGLSGANACILDGAGSYVIKRTEKIQAEWLGAASTATPAVNRAAIQRLVNTAKVSETKTIQFLDGIYQIDDAIDTTGVDCVRFVGAGDVKPTINLATTIQQVTPGRHIFSMDESGVSHFVRLHLQSVAPTLTMTVDETTDTITTSSPHSLITGHRCWVDHDMALPAPLLVDTEYFAIVVSATQLKLATSLANALAGTAIDLTDQGSGNRWLYPFSCGIYTNSWQRYMKITECMIGQGLSHGMYFADQAGEHPFGLYVHNNYRLEGTVWAVYEEVVGAHKRFLNNLVIDSPNGVRWTGDFFGFNTFENVWRKNVECNGTRATVISNSFSFGAQGTATGIQLDTAVKEGVISNNTLIGGAGDYSKGIFVDFSTAPNRRIVISENNISGSVAAIDTRSRAIICNNTIQNCNGFGIQLNNANADRSIVSFNSIENFGLDPAAFNRHGVFVNASVSNAQVVHNSIRGDGVNSTNGVRVNGDNNRVHWNRITLTASPSIQSTGNNNQLIGNDIDNGFTDSGTGGVAISNPMVGSGDFLSSNAVQTITNKVIGAGNSISGDINSIFGGIGTIQNYIPNSDAFEASTWTTGGTVTKEANFTTGPDGSLTAARITGATPSAGSFRTLGVNTGGSVAGQTWSFGIKIKAASAGEEGKNVRLRLADTVGTMTGGDSQNVLTADWKQIKGTGVGNVGAGNTIDIRLIESQSTAVQFFVSQAQMNQGSTLLPYIRNGGTATTTPVYGHAPNTLLSNRILLKTTVRALAGANGSFRPHDGNLHFVDPGGNVNYEPVGTFHDGQVIIIVNTAGSAQTLTIDSMVLALAVAQNQRAIIVYRGDTATWVKIYTGS